MSRGDMGGWVDGLSIITLPCLDAFFPCGEENKAECPLLHRRHEDNGEEKKGGCGGWVESRLDFDLTNISQRTKEM